MEIFLHCRFLYDTICFVVGLNYGVFRRTEFNSTEQVLCVPYIKTVTITVEQHHLMIFFLNFFAAIFILRYGINFNYCIHNW